MKDVEGGGTVVAWLGGLVAGAGRRRRRRRRLTQETALWEAVAGLIALREEAIRRDTLEAIDRLGVVVHGLAAYQTKVAMAVMQVVGEEDRARLLAGLEEAVANMDVVLEAMDAAGDTHRGRGTASS